VKYLITFIPLWMSGFAASLQAGEHLDLPVVRPVLSCEQLAKANLGSVKGGAVTIDSTETLQTPKGSFCMVRGQISQASTFVVALPLEHWTQRFLQSASNSGTSLLVGHSGSCIPAQNGEIALATNDRGGTRRDDSWTRDPQKRIDWAYQYNHITAELSKALIRAFYGQAPRFSYFMGCSGGGREALIVAQRFPDDYNGVTAGAPSAVLSVHNGGFYHGWETHVNQRADGSIILLSSRLGILHDAAVAHCAVPSAAVDGILQMPTACRFDPTWVRCAAGSADTTKCLTAEETAVAQKLYEGARDAAGHRFEMGGFQLGSEMSWSLTRPDGLGDLHKPGGDLKYLLPIPDSQMSVETLDNAFQFNQEWFTKVEALANLYNGANTNLRPLQQRGSKLILWHGAADNQVQPTSSIAYYQGVQKLLGEKLTDSFMRFYLLPGVGHCGNGEGPSQVDLLTPLMAWVELNQAPDMLVVGKNVPAGRRAAPPPAPIGAQPVLERNRAAPTPYGASDEPNVYTRPLYPFPSVISYIGKGDRKDAVNYSRAKAPVTTGLVPDTLALKLYGPDNQKFYRAENGTLVVDKTK
jgi:feruloyl esterase